jgi:hypothetical protein
MTSTFPLKQNVDVLSHVTRGYLEVFRLLWQGVDEMSQFVKIRPDDGTYWPLDQLDMYPNLTSPMIW